MLFAVRGGTRNGQARRDRDFESTGDPLLWSPKDLNARRSAAQIPSITVFRAGDSDDPSQNGPGMDAKAKELATYLAESIQT